MTNDECRIAVIRHSSFVISPAGWPLAIGLALAAIGGCGRGHGLPMVPVSGRVTFAGGPCPAPGNVTFTPVEVAPGLPRRPGSAMFNTDGEFTVTSFETNDGLVAGRYQVSIACYSGLPDPWSADPWGDVSYVPKDYRPAELVVSADSGPIELNFDVPRKQAKK